MKNDKVIGQSSKADTSCQLANLFRVGNLSKIEIENLTYLGKIWGFLKYYHPAVGNGKFDWDTELLRVLPKVIAANSKTSFSDIMENWLDGLGQVGVCQTCSITIKSDGSNKLMPDFNWIISGNTLNKSLVKKLKYIIENRHQGEGYYIAVSNSGNAVFSNENGYESSHYPGDKYRLLALFRYWNIIQYYFPYKYLIGEDWNKILPEFIPKFIAAKDSIQYVLACQELVVRIHDSHASVWENKILEEYRGKYFPLVQTRFIEGELVVTGYYMDTLNIKKQIKIGDVVKSIDGQEVKTLIDKYLYLTNGSNYEVQLRNLPLRPLMRSQKPNLDLVVTRGEKIFKINVKNVYLDSLYRNDDYYSTPADTSYKLINGNIGYVFAGKYKNEQLENIKRYFESTKGMIIDLRHYPNDIMPYTFGAFIKAHSTPFAKLTRVDLDAPGHFSLEDPLVNGEENKNCYQRRIVIIVNSETQSQGEFTTMALQSSPNVIVIGSKTSGADGNYSSIVLPGGILTWFSGKGVYYPDGSETQRVGVKIDLKVYPTIKGIKAGRDELVEKAIEIINKS